jgi:hypothetical protein
MEPEVLNATSNGLDWRQKRVASITVGNAFVTVAILLGGEVEVDADRRLEGSRRYGGSIGGHPTRDIEGCVAKAEGVAMWATAGMLAGAKHIEVANEEEVADGGLDRVGGRQRVDRVSQQSKWNRFDPPWERVSGFPGAVQLLEWRDNIASHI